MVKFAKKGHSIQSIALNRDNAFSHTRSLNPKKLMQNWVTLSASHVYTRCLMTPIYVHNAMIKGLHERKQTH